MKRSIHVAVGIVLNNHNEVLIAKRPDSTHQGGLWEFPGGKVESGETVYDALVREFKEEVDINILSGESFMEIHHDYGDKQVFLDVLLCEEYSGEAIGLEGQEVKWVLLNHLGEFQFPVANRAIIEKLLENL